MRAWLLLLAACAAGPPDEGDAPPTAADRIAAWSVRGPHAVGYRELSVVWDDPASGGPRTNRVGLWYPTEDTSRNAVSFSGPNAPRDVRGDAEPLPGPFPLWLFSHGHQGDLDNCAGLLTHAASHGWIAAAVEHTGNTLADGPDRDTEIYVQRPLDVSAALDHLEATLPVDGRVFATGHSFGGYTMFPLAGGTWAVDAWSEACGAGDEDPFCSTWSPALEDLLRAGAADPRIGAFATLSGGNWGQLREAGFAAVQAPLLQVSGALDGSVTNEGSSDPIWRDLAPGDKVRVDLAHGDHQTYTDFAAALGGVLPGTSADALEAERGYRILRVYLQAFAHAHALGDAAGTEGILDGTVEVDPDVTLSTK